MAKILVRKPMAIKVPKYHSVLLLPYIVQGDNYKWDDFDQGYQLTKRISLKLFSHKLLVHYVDYNL